MKYRIFPIIATIVALAAVMSSCSTASKAGASRAGKGISLEQELNEQWVGRTHAEIVLEKGAPSRETSDGLDGKILVYEKTTTRVSSDLDEGFGAISPSVSTTVRTSTDWTQFFLDGDGTCYLVKTNEVCLSNGQKSVLSAIITTGYTVISIGGLIALIIGGLSMVF